MSARRISTAIVSAAALAAMIVAAFAQADYPRRAIKIIVPNPPGTGPDVLPRIIGEKLTAKWGQPIIIENRPGGALNIGAEAVAKAEPDGYTLLASPAPPLAINQSLYPHLAFDPAAFMPVTVMAQTPNVLMINPKIPASNLQEFITYAKARPGKLTYASAGNGSTPHLTMELLKNLAGLDIVHVPYKGLGPALTDVIAGHVDMMFDNLVGATPPIRHGKVKALGIGSEQRDKLLPDIPAFAETYPGFRSVAWFAIVAPPKTPTDITSKLSAAITEIIRQPDVAKRFEDLLATPVASTPAETAAFIKDERERWHKVIVAAGIKPE
jgi:tripartite-type tricarboxylate transporter receptor subunit TctC